MRRSRQAVLAAVLGLAAVAFVPVPVLTPGAPAAAQADGSGSFTATFDTPSDFYDRFDTYAGNYTEDNCFETRCRQEGNGINPTEWPGDHDHSTTATGTCTPPTSTRTVAPTPHSQMFYWCAPGGPATGHVMTSIDTSQYAIIAFSPKQSFTDVNRVCVDLNRTDLGGGKWANIAIVPEATFLEYPNPNPNRVSDGEGPYRLDYVTPAFSEANGVGSFSVQDIGDVFSVKYFRGSVDINRGFDIVDSTNDGFIGNDDKATRYQHCVVEHSNNTVTATRLGPNGTTSVTAPGQLPSGPVRVIFEDDTYDSIKHDGRPQFKTWHWDNVTITTGPPIAPGIGGGPAPDVTYPPSVAGQFDSLFPARLLDTRGPYSTTDGQFAGGGAKAAGSITELQVAGRGHVPATARAVSLNVTAVEPQGDGFVTVFPCGTVPTASNLNYRAGDVVPNAVVADLDASGRVCVYTYAATHLLVDVNGAFPSQSSFRPLTPARLYDSRAANSTIDGAGAGDGVRGAGTVTRVSVAGRGGVPASAFAAALNVTVVDALGEGFATVFPCGQGVPIASNVNYRNRDVVANMVISELGAGGEVCVYTDAATHLVLDVAGWFPAGGSFGGVQPARLLDTRGPGSTVDGQAAGGGASSPGSIVVVPVTGRGQIPAGAGAVALNVTAVDPRADGFATVFPCGQPVPLASNLNFRAGDVVPNSVVSRVGSDGTVCIFVDASTQLLVDVTGWFPA